MTQLFLVRHGETEWSAVGRHTSVTDLDLTANGVAGAELLRGRLDPADFGLVLCSPRLRARRTAELAGFGDAIEICDDLVEWNYGSYEGRTGVEIRAERPGWAIWTGNPPGGETAEQVTERLNRVIDRALASGVDRVLLFGHGHSLRALTLCWLGLPFSVGDQFPLETATVSVLGHYKDGRAMIRWNAEP